MESCLYEGVVRHRRFRPVKHAFRYSLFMLWLDLDEADALARHGLFAQGERFASACFRAADHLPTATAAAPESKSQRSARPSEAAQLKAAIVRQVAEQTGLRLTGPVRLLTQLRYWGYYFSPLNLYYCHQAGGELACVVAEVNNIPWRERHWYFLWSGTAEPRPNRYQHPKAFHVSPFMPMEQTYRWRLTEPGERLVVQLSNFDGANASVDPATGSPAPAAPIFSATLALRKRPLTRTALAGAMLRHGWMSAKVVAAIYFEAFRLWLKSCPYFAHPETLATAPSSSR